MPKSKEISHLLPTHLARERASLDFEKSGEQKGSFVFCDNKFFIILVDYVLKEIEVKNKSIIIYFSVISVIGIALIIVLSAGAKPFDDSPAIHLEELKQIPEAAAFYQKYGHHGVDVFPDGAFTYQVGFQADNEQEQWIQLIISYRFGIPSSSTAFCTPDGIESQYWIKDNVLDYLKEQQCF
jgi:hypothetical protein